MTDPSPINLDELAAKIAAIRSAEIAQLQRECAFWRENYEHLALVVKRVTRLLNDANRRRGRAAQAPPPWSMN